MSKHPSPEWSPGAAGPLLRLTPVADPRTLKWQDLAACAEADPDRWYPERGSSARQAKDICRYRCPVRAQCLEYALDHSEHVWDVGRWGIWGGLSPEERNVLLAERDAA